MSQTQCVASKAREGSLTAEQMPGGVAAVGVPGRKPGVNLLPPLLEVANPISVAPPPKMRPTWKAETSVLPAERVSCSTSVACWPGPTVNGSLLNWSRVVLARAEIVVASANRRAKVTATRVRGNHLKQEIRDMVIPP